MAVSPRHKKGLGHANTPLKMMMNLTGRYELDRERSESLYTHMKSLQCDEIAALASEKLHVTIDIVQNDSELHIWQNSQLGDTKRMLLLEGETIESDTRRATMTLSPSNVVIETVFNKGRLVDRRHFEEDGELMVQQLELTVNGSAGVVRTRRVFKKVGPPDPSVTKGMTY
jgi:hypothetical protein